MFLISIWPRGLLFFWARARARLPAVGQGRQVSRNLCQKGGFLEKGLESLGDASCQKTELGGVHPENPSERVEPSSA